MSTERRTSENNENEQERSPARSGRRKSYHGVSALGVTTKFFLYLIITLVFIRCAAWCYSFGHSIFYSSSVDEKPGRDIVVNIGEGMNDRSTAMYLFDRGLIVSEFSFIVQARVFDFDIEPGEYTLNTSQTSREILKILSAGPSGAEEVSK